jgi:hypothetical protein
MHEYEEFHEWSTGWSWAFIIFLSGSLISICMLAMMLIKDVPREWDHGEMDFTPAASVYSSSKPAGKDNNMVLPLPGGKKMGTGDQNKKQ